MSTWDDKPNDYEHAVAVIERMREHEKTRNKIAQAREETLTLLRDAVEKIAAEGSEFNYTIAEMQAIAREARAVVRKRAA